MEMVSYTQEMNDEQEQEEEYEIEQAVLNAEETEQKTKLHNVMDRHMRHNASKLEETITQGKGCVETWPQIIEEAFLSMQTSEEISRINIKDTANATYNT